MKKVILGSLVLMMATGLAGCGETADIKKQMKQIEKGEKTGMEILMEQNDNVTKFKGLPGWAKKLGAVEPVGLTLDSKESDSTVEDAKKHMNESFHAQYTGEPEILMTEARKLVEKLDGKIFHEENDSLIANGELNGGTHSLSITVRTDVDKPFMSYGISGRKTFE